MLVAKVDPGDIRQLVDAFKSEGTFDKLRRKIFSTIAATVCFDYSPAVILICSFKLLFK